MHSCGNDVDLDFAICCGILAIRNYVEDLAGTTAGPFLCRFGNQSRTAVQSFETAVFIVGHTVGLGGSF